MANTVEFNSYLIDKDTIKLQCNYNGSNYSLTLNKKGEWWDENKHLFNNCFNKCLFEFLTDVIVEKNPFYSISITPEYLDSLIISIQYYNIVLKYGFIFEFKKEPLIENRISYLHNSLKHIQYKNSSFPKQINKFEKYLDESVFSVKNNYKPGTYVIEKGYGGCCIITKKIPKSINNVVLY